MLTKIIMALFGGSPPKPVVILVPVDSLDLSLDTWRSHEELVSEWAKLAKLPIYRAFITTMRNESPVHYFPEAMAADEKIKRLGLIEGYQLALNNLEVFGNLIKRADMPEATFEAPEEEPNTQKE